MSTLHKIRIKTNSTYIARIRWVSDAGTPYILSDASMQVRPEVHSDTVLIDANVGNGLITLDVTDGWANIKIPPSAMANIEWFGTGVYDILVTRVDDGVELGVLEGPAIVVRGVTRG